MKYFWGGTALCAAMLAPPSQAASPADTPSSAADEAARQLQRQQDRERVQREQLQAAPDVRLPRPRAIDLPPGVVVEADGAPCFPIHEVVLQGDAEGRLAFALDAIPGRDQWGDSPACLGTAGINAAMQAVQNAILQRGFVTTRVLAAPQDLRGGVLVLTLVPGRLNAVRWQAGQEGHAGTLSTAVPADIGGLLDLRDIEQGLENLKRAPSVDADIQIEATSEPGLSDLVVSRRQGRPLRLSASVDDSGSRATGKTQGSVTLSYDPHWALNDLFYATLSRSLGEGGGRGTDGDAVHYSVPFGYWLLGINAGSNRYDQSVAGASQTYRYAGRSANGSVQLSRVLLRDGTRKATIFLAAWTRRSRNYIDDTEVQVQRRRMAGFDLGLTHREFMGCATLDLTMTYRRGTGARHALAAPEEPFGEGTSRPSIVKLDAQLSVPWRLGDQRWRYGLGWRAQWNRSPLVPQDRFSIGNRYSVRGFDGESTLSAERGWLLRNDVAWSVPDRPMEVFVGADVGGVGGASATQLVGQRLAGGVVGLRGQALSASFEMFAGRPLHKPEGFRTSRTSAGFSLNWSY